MRRLLLLVVAATAACAARADVVQTLGGRLEGKVAFAADGLQVAGNAVAWGEVLFVIRDSATRSIRPPEALRLASGEVWLGHVSGLAAGKVKARFGLLGDRELDVAALRAVDFLPTLAPPEPGDKPATLYREKGEPVPGQLLWIDETRLAMDSPLGVLTLSREGLARYLFKGDARPGATGDDEVSLVDGSTLRGLAKPGKGGLEVQHALLGAVTVPERMLRSVLRRPANAAYVAELKPASVNAVPLVAKGVPPEALEYPTRGDSRAWPGELVAIRAIRIQPQCSATYRLPKLGGQKVSLFATLAAVDGARGVAKLRLVAAGKTLLEREVGPASKREAVSVALPPDAELGIEVAFGPPVLFPCGVVVGDPVAVGQ